MTAIARALARRVMLNLLDAESPLTTRAVTYGELFDLIRTDEGAAISVIYEASAIIAGALTDLATATPSSVADVINAHTT